MEITYQAVGFFKCRQMKMVVELAPARSSAEAAVADATRIALLDQVPVASDFDRGLSSLLTLRRVEVRLVCRELEKVNDYL